MVVGIKKNEEFKVGDEIEFIGVSLGYPTDFSGKILKIIPSIWRSGRDISKDMRYIVDFKGFEKGHNCEGYFEEGYKSGWYCRFQHMRHILSDLDEKGRKIREENLKRDITNGLIEFNKIIENILKGHGDFLVFYKTELYSLIKKHIEYLVAKGYEREELEERYEKYLKQFIKE